MIPAPVHRITLQDGRILAYSLYGDPQGIPVLFLHGTPGSNRLTRLAESGALAHGFKLIAPDRPGIGDSSLQPDRELYHYPLDIVQLLDHLELGKCGIIAISGGSPYAFQCAHDLPQRIAYVVSLSGWVSYGRAGLNQIKIDPLFRFVGWAGHHARALVPLIGKSARWTVTQKAEQFMQHLYHKLPPSDQKLMDDATNRTVFLDDLQNAFRQGWEGVAQEVYVHFSTPLFALEMVRQPVMLMHGTADTVVPYAFAEYLRDHLPNVADFCTIEGGGHLCAVSEQHALFARIKEITKD